MDELKVEIIRRIQMGEGLPESEIAEYRRERPYDTDGAVLLGAVFLHRGEYPEAREQLEEALRCCPYDADIWYLMGQWYVRQGMPVEAIRHLSKATLLQAYYHQEYMFFEVSTCEREMGLMVELLKEKLQEKDSAEYEQIKKEYDILRFEDDKEFWLLGSLIQEQEDMIGKTLYFGKGRTYYTGFLNPMGEHLLEGGQKWNFINTKGEILTKIYEGKMIGFGTNQSVLLPILSKADNNDLTFVSQEGERTVCLQVLKQHFNYYRIDKPVSIFGEEDFVMGSPVSLGHDAGRKKLVISLFVDGLSQEILREEGLKKLMPYTYDFFKKGMICENVFTTSDWTYPSLASIVSGLEVPQHLMVHPDINHSLPEESKLLFEQLKEAGYYTAMINGDWRSCEPYGYLRGIDRCISQLAYVGMNTGEVVYDAINHMEAFRETDQYLWIGTADLHKVADGYDLPLAVQTQTSLEERSAEEKSVTSVKQKFSIRKRQQYIKLMRQVDLHLRALYEYVEENYQEEEFLLTLFSDHGQTFLNKPDQFHLCRNHSNVGFMCRGGGVSGRSREYISTTSYPAILCSLLGMDYNGISNNLPAVFGGNAEREYVITETVHPGDPYMAAIHGKWGAFYYKTEEALTSYGKLPQGNAEYILFDEAGNRVEDEERCQKYIKVLQSRISHLYEY